MQQWEFHTLRILKNLLAFKHLLLFLLLKYVISELQTPPQTIQTVFCILGIQGMIIFLMFPASRIERFSMIGFSIFCSLSFILTNLASRLS